MLENAALYENELKEELAKIWYDPKYQYYFGSEYRRLYKFGDDQLERAFVSLNKDKKIIGFIDYNFNPNIRLANCFGAINFRDDKESKVIFGRDLMKTIDDIFVKFNASTMSFCVIIGNPVEKQYDRLCEKIGGRIIGIKKNRAQDLQGNLCDSKEYEVLREDYFSNRRNKLSIKKEEKDTDDTLSLVIPSSYKRQIIYRHFTGAFFCLDSIKWNGYDYILKLYRCYKENDLWIINKGVKMEDKLSYLITDDVPTPNITNQKTRLMLWEY